MDTAEFKTNWISDAQIQVEDIAEGHVWTFTFGQNGLGERMISSGGEQRSPDHIRADALGGRARRYADREAQRAGKIDRILY